MRKLTLLLLLSTLALSSCKKEKKNYPLQMLIKITEQSSSTKISMDITDQNGNVVFTMKDREQISEYFGTKDLYSGDVLTVHYSSNKQYNASLDNGSAKMVFTRDNKELAVVNGDLGYITGKTIQIVIP